MRRENLLSRILPVIVVPVALAMISPAARADPLASSSAPASVRHRSRSTRPASTSPTQAGRCWSACDRSRCSAPSFEYVDFGRPSASPFNQPTDVHVEAAVLSALLYAPLPGSTSTSTPRPASAVCSRRVHHPARGRHVAPINNPNCALFSFDRTDTSFAFGVGAQVKVSSFAIRGEYQRFSSDLGDPTFWSLALTWSF